MFRNQAGKNEEGSNRLYIANSETTKPLIWGDFEGRMVVVNGNSADNPEGMTLFVNGPAGGGYALVKP